MKTAMSGLLAAVLVAAVPALADPGQRARGINQRQHNQQQRIEQGWRQGDLTRGETRQLQHQTRDIRREEHAFRSDGRFTPAEHQHVQRDLDRLSQNIHRERHDGEFARHQPRHAWSGSHDPRQFRAFNGDPRIDRIQQRQHDRIVQGIRSGELTRREAHRLIEEQRAIRAEERAYLADGVLTRAERADLCEDLSDARRHIYNETHDAQIRR